MTLFWVLLVIIVLFLLAGLAWWGLKRALLLSLNSVVGFFALYAVRAWLLDGLVINLWSVLLTALFGIFGFLLVIALHLLNLAL